MYFIHVTLAYLVVLCGTMCLVCRVIWHPYHAMFGRLYIVCMLWCMGTSLLIHNTGLPAAVLVSFVWVVGGITVGWFLIKEHQNRALIEMVNRICKSPRSISSDEDARRLISSTKREIATAQRTWSQRMFSLKAAHGALMFMSYLNMVGRLFSSNQSGHFGCYTYHVYKPLDSYKFNGTDRPIAFVPEDDPDRATLPWTATGLFGWGALFSLGPLVMAFGFGSVWAACHVQRKDGSGERERSSLLNIPLVLNKD
jgi:hypothetical protein